MKSGLVFIIGLFAAVALPLAGIVMGSNAQLGSLAPYYDDSESATLPYWFPGVASQGERVYRDLGCAECHTQQVRRPDQGSDQARGWGDRQNVARDYIYQPFPQLGSARVGPDLANLGGRKPTAPDSDDLLNLLYKGQGGMPAYRFLFELRKANGGISAHALNLTGSLKPAPGWEVVPMRSALSLVGYLVNLNSTYDLPEAQPVVAAGSKAPATPAAPGAAAAPPAALRPGRFKKGRMFIAPFQPG